MNEYKFSEIYVGLSVCFEAIITDEMIEIFRELSGDINPLHLNVEYAKEKGYPSVVCFGMLTASFYSTLVGVHLPGKYCILQGLDIQFSKPVFAGDHLRISGKVSYINDAYKQIEIKALIENKKGQKVSKALIKTGVLDE